MSTLLHIDEWLLGQHASLSQDDCCYYLFEYSAHKKTGYGRGNRLIINCKKPMDRQGRPEWVYKERAILEIAGELRTCLPSLIDFAVTTMIPVPPSKTRTHPAYDDRLWRILQHACPPGSDIRDLIACREDRDAAHEGDGSRPSVAGIQANYRLNDGRAPKAAATAPQAAGTATAPQAVGLLPVRPRVVIFDDVITAGSHYKACRNFIDAYFPGRAITGVFVARRAIPRV